LPEYTITPQTLRKLHDTLVDRNVQDPAMRKVMFEAAGHTELVATAHYVAERDVMDAVESARLYALHVHPFLVDVQVAHDAMDIFKSSTYTR
jgi:hypothetical protein